MARHYTVLPNDLVLQELKRHLEKRAGIQLNSFSDCKRLSEVLDQAGTAISALTLSRCFGFSKSEHRPFVSTLNLLSVYLGFRSFNHFTSENNDRVRWSLTHPDLKFEQGDFAYTALELAIQTEDWATTRLILESFDPNLSNTTEFVWFLGTQMRSLKKKDGFLALLADTEIGRKYFYEGFVDEDDPDNYYSDALRKFYAPKVNVIGDQIFYNTYLSSKQLYCGKKVDWKSLQFINDSSLDFNELHYHQVSRLIEMRIFQEFVGLNRRSKMEQILNELLPRLAREPWQNRSATLSRALKALVFTGHFDYFVKHHQALHNSLQGIIQDAGNRRYNVGDLVLQFLIHSSKPLQQYAEQPPMKVQLRTFNEDKARLTLESATAALYCKPELRKVMVKNLEKFTANSENSWVLQLLSKNR
ncbi:MAG: hypothetical protein FGM14_05635 [Flavobacteriales bacterium]|nr:hypothetical protein [Flavobacteriales bacterium]